MIDGLKRDLISAEQIRHACHQHVLRKHHDDVFPGQQATQSSAYSCSLAGDEAVYSIPDGELSNWVHSSSQARLVQAWIEIHRDDLMAD